MALSECSETALISRSVPYYRLCKSNAEKPSVSATFVVKESQ